VKSKDIFKTQKGTLNHLKNNEDSFVLQDFQIVNHFYKNSFITSKIGLTGSLKEM
jgi:hypothetical protein